MNQQNYKILFISPHHDDVAFSLSGVIQYLSEIRRIKLNLVNIFSISNHIKSEFILRLAKNKELTKFATNIRKNEDEYFCKKYNISFLNMDIEESAIFCNPFDILKEDINIKMKKSIIIKKIKDFCGKKEIILFIPLAIGKHRDHLKIYNFMMNFFKSIKNSNIVFYEDSPYINYDTKRYDRLSEIKKFLNDHGYEKINFYLNKEFLLKKIYDIKNYKSQISDKEYDNFEIKKYCNFDGRYYETLWISSNNIKNLLNI